MDAALENSLDAQVKACSRCALSPQCRAPVPGVRVEDRTGGILFVGEAPGETEDRVGKPFIGKAGKVLEEHLLAKAAIHLEDHSVTNAVKCLPPLRKLDGKKDKTRKPLPEEVEACSIWLKAEIALLRPQVIVALGDTAGRALIPRFQSVLVQHGKFWPSPHGPVLSAVHPSACLHQPTMFTLFRGDMGELGKAWASGECETVEDQYPKPKYGRLTLGFHLSRMPFKGKLVALDTEASVDDEVGDRLGTVPWSVQVSSAPGEATLLEPDLCKKPLEELWRKPPPGFTHCCPEVVVHNATYDVPMLKKMSVDLSDHTGLEDSMIAAQVLQTEPAGLKALALRHAGMWMQEYPDVVWEGQQHLSFDYLARVLRESKGMKWWAVRPITVVDPETGEEKLKKPWPPAKCALRILGDMDAGKCDNPLERWQNVERRAEVEKVLGPMPVAGLADVPFEEAKTYACADADATLRVWPVLKNELRRMDLWDVYRMDMDALPLVLMMEEVGMGVDLGALATAEQVFQDEMRVLGEKIDEVAGRRINPASPKQTSWLLFEKLKFPKNKKRGYETSTNDKLIELHAGRHPVVGWIQSWREARKLVSSYVVPVREKVLRAMDRRLHARLKITGTPTGRMTANDPNVLAVPSRSQWGKMIKKAFRAREGCAVLNADFSQVELRIFAHETGEKKLIEDYQKGADLHKRTAGLAYGIPVEDVTDAQRSHGKTLNFGIIYGISAAGLAVQLGVSERQAQGFIDGYFAGYTRVGAWMREVEAECRRSGFVRDLWGRIRHIGGIYSPDKAVYGEAVRQACNAKIQSAASGMIKRAMRDILPVVKEMRDRGFVCDPWVQVHDALVFEVSAEIAEEFGRRLKKVMESVRKLVVPVVADVSFGPSWGEQTTKIGEGE